MKSEGRVSLGKKFIKRDNDSHTCVALDVFVFVSMCVCGSRIKDSAGICVVPFTNILCKIAKSMLS